jgi:lipid A 3-O-deacylase
MTARVGSKKCFICTACPGWLNRKRLNREDISIFRITHKVIVAVAVLCVWARGGMAEEVSAPETGWSITEATEDLVPFTVTLYWENDGSILKRNKSQDRHYTNGSAISFAHQPDWVEGFKDVAGFGEVFDRTAAGYMVGQLIFTPEHISETRLLRKDRPYVGYLFGGVYVQRANDQTFDHAQLDIGVIGPSSQGERFQKDIHDWLNLDEPKGWDNQLSDEVTAQLTLRRKWRVDMQAVALSGSELSQQLIPQVELAAGSVYRHVAAGMTWRVGHNLPDDFGPGRLADVAAATGVPRHGNGGYGFIRVAGRVVQHDIFLEGNSFKNSHGVNAETFVGEIQAGLEVFYYYDQWRLQAGYSQTFVSEQFEGQEGTDAYGALVLSASRGF